MSRKALLCLSVVVALLAVAVVVGCAKKGAGTAGPGSPGPGGKAAAPTKAVAEMVDVTLTEDLVTKWIASAKDENVNRIMEKIKPAEEVEDTGKVEEEGEAKPGETATPAEKPTESPEQEAKEMEKLKQQFLEAGADAELDTAVKALGFKDGAEWASVTIKVMAGLLPAIAEQGLEMMKGMGVKEDSEEYKTAKAEMDAEIGAIAKGLAELTPEETKVVADKLAEIQAAMEAGKETRGAAGETPKAGEGEEKTGE